MRLLFLTEGSSDHRRGPAFPEVVLPGSGGAALPIKFMKPDATD